MALNIENPEVEQLAAELAAMAKTSKTEAIRQALIERLQRVAAESTVGDKAESLLRFMEIYVGYEIPASASRPWTKQEEQAAHGYGEFGEPA